MPPPDSLPDFSKDFAIFFGKLLEIVGANAKPKKPALVLAAGDRSLWMCDGYIGGKDVELVMVRPKVTRLPRVKEALTYRKDVGGTDLVYDLTGEFMQGKARPFDCDLRETLIRLYALLPFQVENLAMVARQQQDKIAFEVEFQNALGKRVEGALPCYAELRTPDGEAVWASYLATSKDGRLQTAADLPPNGPRGKWSLVVRSQVDGKVVTVPVEVGPVAGK